MSNLSAFIMEALEEALQELIGVVDPLRVFAHNPDHGRTSVGLIQRVQVFTQSGNYALIPEQIKVLKQPISALVVCGLFRIKSIFPEKQRYFGPCCFFKVETQTKTDLLGYFLKMSLMTTMASCTT